MHFQLMRRGFPNHIMRMCEFGQTLSYAIQNVPPSVVIIQILKITTCVFEMGHMQI